MPTPETARPAQALTPKTDTGFWDCIDAVLVVNLKHRTDRWERIHAILRRHLPQEKIVRVDAVYGKQLPGFGEPPWFTARTSEQVAGVRAGAAGCCLSHRKAIEMARAVGYQRILLMEDDAEFFNELDTPEGDAIAQVLRQDDGWDLFYLGYYQRLNKHHVVSRHDCDGRALELWRIRGPLMLHAAVIHERVFDKMLDDLPNPDNPWWWMTYWGSIDSWIYNKFGRDPKVRIWATDPKLIMQYVSYSDICGRDLKPEEAIGTHFESTMVPLDAKAFERCIARTPGERVYQFVKRAGRCIRCRLLGFKKT